jgi:hypothetical protein
MLRRMSSNRVVLAGALLLAACGAKKGDKQEEPATAVEPAPAPAPPPAPAPAPAPAAPAPAPAPDPALAKQQALEQARTAGILGSAALQQGGAFASLTGTADFSSGFDDVDIQGGLLGNEAGEMQGGFGYGRSGFGPGGGGTGWGTIGTGRYGTIGHGSGTGSGYGSGSGRGGMSGRSSGAVPQLRIGNAQVSGDLDKNIIRRYVRRNLPKLSYCYEKQLLAEPGLAGTVQTHFVIDGNGTTQDVSANGVKTEVADCMADVLRAIQYPKPKDGKPVTVTYPFVVRPTGG